MIDWVLVAWWVFVCITSIPIWCIGSIIVFVIARFAGIETGWRE